jgi:uncharacterized protein YndB with AHSA1/START domain
MPTVSAETHVAAPPDRIWALLEDFSRMPQYVHFMREVFDYTMPPLRVGSKYSERSKPGPVEAVSHWVVTEVERPRRQVHETHMPDFEAKLTVTMDAHEGGTRYAQATEFRAMPRFRPLGWLLETLFMRRLMQRHMERIVARIKELAEAG